MFLTIDFQKLISLEFCVYCPHFFFFIDFLSMKSFVFYDGIFVFPGSPNLILNLLLLFWGLFYCVYYYSLSAVDLNELISLLLFNYHLTSSLFSLMLLFFSLSSSQTSLISAFFLNSQWLLSFFKQFGCLLRRSLLIWIITFLSQIFLLKLSNVIVQRFDCVHFRHCFVMTLLKLNLGFVLFIFWNLRLPYGHINCPFF